MAKVLGLALALSCANDEVWARVGVEPSGDPFNSLVQLEYECGIPRNPLINPGGLVVADILLSHLPDARADILAFARALSGAPQVRFDPAVAQSELDTAFRNRALANLMKAFGNIRNPVERVLDLYIHLCSLEMTCRQAARAFVFLADRGRSLSAAATPELSIEQIRRINALMLTCGFYDEAGDFAFEVGLPGKSGVGGGIVAICPQRFCAVTWSPRLSDKGNSERGTRALQILTSRADASIFS
jgi:glutaminase